MFGYSRLFRSRWSALLWAAGIIWFAIEVATPDQPARDDTNAAHVLE